MFENQRFRLQQEPNWPIQFLTWFLQVRSPFIPEMGGREFINGS